LRNLNECFICWGSGAVFSPFDYAPAYEILLFCLNSLKQVHYRLISVGLWYELSANSEVENGLPELLDLIGALGEAREVADEEPGMVAQFFRILTVAQVMMCGCSELIPAGLPLILSGFQTITHSHQVVQLRNDPVLLSKRW
jgi:hypothetical protein